MCCYLHFTLRNRLIEIQWLVQSELTSEGTRRTTVRLKTKPMCVMITCGHCSGILICHGAGEIVRFFLITLPLLKFTSLCFNDFIWVKVGTFIHLRSSYCFLGSRHHLVRKTQSLPLWSFAVLCKRSRKFKTTAAKHKTLSVR